MLILCYGITKSGSTLAFELIKGMLKSAGHSQARLPDGPVTPGHGVNFTQSVNRQRLDELLSAIGERWVAVKTHVGIRDPIFAYLEDLQEQRRVQIVASYRDPRDVCLSMMDAGAQARARGRGAFSEFTDLQSAVTSVSRQIEKFRKWGALSGALKLNYDLVAFSPDDAIDRIERTLGFVCNREQAKEHAFADAFTQKNKARRHRAREELSEQDYAALTETFSDFIRNVCENEDDAWFSAVREQILAGINEARGRPRRAARGEG